MRYVSWPGLLLDRPPVSFDVYSDFMTMEEGGDASKSRSWQNPGALSSRKSLFLVSLFLGASDTWQHRRSLIACASVVGKRLGELCRCVSQSTQPPPEPHLATSSPGARRPSVQGTVGFVSCSVCRGLHRAVGFPAGLVRAFFGQPMVPSTSHACAAGAAGWLVGGSRVCRLSLYLSLPPVPLSLSWWWWWWRRWDF
ncbi:hypothetical protein LY76DRAFT_257429 [Colletotrichum caudatum]|nr:hypothetical protein LY76DRAFT_257429 [Colletotrichum caudatum]